MADRNSQFVVDSLRPESLGGDKGKTYQLTVSSTNPTRTVGVDDAGMPVEESVPAAYSRMFVGLDGCIRDVPMRTGAGCSMEPEAERYEHVTMREIIKAGVLPVEVCPYTGSLKYITGANSLVKVPAGESDCGGSPAILRDTSGQVTSGGCVHMQTVITERKARSLKKHDETNVKYTTMSPAELSRINGDMADAIGVAIAKNIPSLTNGRARLRDGKADAE